MVRVVGLLLLMLCVSPAHAAPSLTGFWLTQDHEGVVAIEPCGNSLCARIAGLFLDHATDRMPVNYQGTSQCGLTLIADARQIRPNLWEGHITDPRNGFVWSVELHLDPRGNLALRGFLGIPLLGRTQTWTRYPGIPPADCRMRPEDSTAGHRRPG